ncbi:MULTISPECIES: fluoride efflux transporter CrcB [unclassified Leptolyngbya]|uniref:fluoride efflux transporter CrcB n=1 Tax=unclassified Leptolyngbya TaxID=2650499 RepID=UPI0016888874|nr:MULTISPECIES: fluoride efflux transporter CrcB [unclassified Leptolyngbya]MBD1910604.1 fluoride efflux transporter CrcB [Leptolyngbya sp. FACHB-8]MBD2154544.1 fluoride efflux transporter CrcB [Leptolyngbya sp. FACHB-16]
MGETGIRAAIAISLGAIAGALSRYYFTLLFKSLLDAPFPYGTFLINLTGCVGIGFLSVWLGDRIPSLAPELKLLLITGFLGSYTTFSTYGLESLSLFLQSRLWIGLAYWLGSAILALPCVYLGTVLAKMKL